MIKAKKFRCNHKKDILKLCYQLELASMRYFNKNEGKIVVSNGLDQDDFIQNKVTWMLTQYLDEQD